MKQLVVVSLFLLLAPQAIYAETLSGESYTIQLNATKTPRRVNQQVVTPTTTPPPLKPAAARIRTFGNLSMRVTENIIDFGLLEAATPLKRQSSIVVSSPTGSTLLAYENEQQALDDGTTIPDTTCDTGQCTTTREGVWSSPLTFGFGYSVESDLYRPFARAGQKPMLLLEGMDLESAKSLALLLKTNVSAGQTKGSYTNTVSLLALPSL